jgi:hypothetical protein
MTGPALRTFFRIAGAWKLAEHEELRILGLDNRSTLRSWRSGLVDALPEEALERISHVMGIYAGLQILLPKTADEWLRKPNNASVFGGRSAIDRMASGNLADLFAVRQYIDAQTR